MNELDGKAVRLYGIPSLLLMEQAAYSVYQYLMEEHKGQALTIVCGPGNNGGDGLALARQFHSFVGARVDVILLVGEEKLSEDGKVYYEMCKRLGIPILAYTKEKSLSNKRIEEAEVLVDAVFGTGLTRNIEGNFYDVIMQMNRSRGFKVSIDMPSGIHTDTGEVLGIAIKADCTITFAVAKVGQFLYPGLACVGILRITKIGIPPILVDQMSCKHYAIDEEIARKLLPNRPIRSNKGTYGKVLMIGGQVGMGGAICLAGQGAMQVGAGLVT